VSVALFIQHAMRMRRNVIGGMSGCKIFFNIILKTARIFFKKKKLLNTKFVF